MRTPLQSSSNAGSKAEDRLRLGNLDVILDIRVYFLANCEDIGTGSVACWSSRHQELTNANGTSVWFLAETTFFKVGSLRCR